MEKGSSTNIFFLEKTLYLIFHILLTIILLLFSSLISGSETSFFSLDKNIINKENKKKSVEKNILLKIIKNKKKLLATILISNNFSNIGIVIITSYLIRKFIKTKYFVICKMFIVSINFLIEVIFLTFVLLLFGEIIPKIYASRNSFRFSIFMSKPIEFLSKILDPINKIMIFISEFIENKITKKINYISVDQLSKALKITLNQKNIKERQFLQKIVDFGSIEIHQIMTPRIDMFALNKKTSFSKLLKLIQNKRYSRVPIYKNSIDNIEGVLFTKDLLPFIYYDNYKWNKLIHNPFFVPEKKKIDDLLSDFKVKKLHLAIVVDEYGGTCGLVTLEDVVEEIVGDIIDEFDKENSTYSKINVNNYFFDGKTSLINFYRIMNVKEEIFFEKNKGDADTLGGFIMEINKDFPKLKQKINFLNYSFIIKSINDKRIKTIEVIRNKLCEINSKEL
ncbi:gliding motility-associated protein GldE [Blattabacterium cuenoti]|uniref:gliding motility-associated protein GldE n=1 Tax=Blattabacterium cuenoti TaxID=1653831 RepID=UPI00163B9095|nr:gliding motility-associated protein GldE [Blattabacterium cuenoti]